MQAANDKVVTIDYELKDSEGNLIDKSENGEFAYLHGASNIIPGLENALSGKQKGDAVQVTINPEEAYGEIDAGKIQQAPKNMFPEGGFRQDEISVSSSHSSKELNSSKPAESVLS